MKTAALRRPTSTDELQIKITALLAQAAEYEARAWGDENIEARIRCWDIAENLWAEAAARDAGWQHAGVNQFGFQEFFNADGVVPVDWESAVPSSGASAWRHLCLAQRIRFHPIKIHV